VVCRAGNRARVLRLGVESVGAGSVPAARDQGQYPVYAETDQYLASLSDADLEQPLDLSQIGLGPQTVASTLTLLLLNHIGTETTEIACLKGLQGARGYPF
jgi:hypothetical protein